MVLSDPPLYLRIQSLHEAGFDISNISGFDQGDLGSRWAVLAPCIELALEQDLNAMLAVLSDDAHADVLLQGRIERLQRCGFEERAIFWELHCCYGRLLTACVDRSSGRDVDEERVSLCFAAFAALSHLVEPYIPQWLKVELSAA